MEQSFSDYAGDVLAQLEPPLPPPEGQEQQHILDPWREVSVDVPLLDAGGEGLPAALRGWGDDWGEEKSLLDGNISELGVEALAFYKSLRFINLSPFRGHWGVFVFDFSIKYLSDELEAFKPGRWTASERAAIAFKTLRDHELFHFRVDVWALGAEGITKKALYQNYLNHVYIPAHRSHSLSLVEESLANAFAFSRAKRAGYALWLRQFMRAQPGAYAAFDQQPPQFMGARLAGQFLHCCAAPEITGRISWEHSPFIGFGATALVGDQNCPIYRIPSLRPSRIFPAITLPSVTEIRDAFLPQYLKGHVVRTTDHRYVQIDNGEQVKVPNSHGRDRLLLHEYKNITHKAGMTGKDYRNARLQTNVWRQHCPRTEPKPPIA